MDENNQLKEELARAIQMAAEANFKIDQLQIENEGLLNGANVDLKSPFALSSVSNYFNKIQKDISPRFEKDSAQKKMAYM